MGKKFYLSKTINFFALVLAAGGLDIVESLINQTDIGWREIALAVVGITGIALRLRTEEPIKY